MYSDYTSYTAAVLELMAGDKLYVMVSDITDRPDLLTVIVSLVTFRPETNVVGSDDCKFLTGDGSSVATTKF
jgi:hypothetical protein